MKTEEQKEKARLAARQFYYKNKEHCAAMAKAYREKNRERLLQNNREYYRQNKAKYDENRKKWRAKPENKIKRCVTDAKWRDANREKVREYSRKWLESNREWDREIHRRYYRRLKLNTIAAYGGHCVCCGETEVDFLSIDHIYNDGGAERKKNGNKVGVVFYRKLKREGWPKDRYQLLCYNCNMSKGHAGACPHLKVGGVIAGVLSGLI